ncbi:MAG: tRNA 2-thiouridine(34) synthase MnmA [Lachnospiraceae bacterium]|nr:tRNA 2-thiouridine(34) synthase MnmA [Lachnospiraceae bacterium]
MKSVIIGLSGGVDSSVSALLLQRAGYRVLGVTMRTWREERDVSSFEQIERDARITAESLGIPHYVFDYSDPFRKKVVDVFVREYQNGRTPNPCVLCNRYVKWESLLAAADSLGADFVATGHYANVIKLQNGRYTLSEASNDSGKDQTYALFGLTQEQLKRTLMPLGSFSKEEVRKLAAEYGLTAAKKPDSEENCFIPDNDYAAFITRYSGEAGKPGNFVDPAGNILGRHKGIIHYTIGQRRGLGLALGYPVFVKEIRPETNEVVAAMNSDLLSCSLTADQLRFMARDHFEDGELVTAKIRYNHKGASARIFMRDSGRMEVIFDEAQRAAAPGQAVVLYQQGHILGGGTIL